MKLRKYFKKIAAVSMAILVTVAGIPYHSVVRAASDDYPDEILFPISVLDFRADNLLFEYAFDGNWYSPLALYDDLGSGRGKGLVEEELGPDGTPVYTKDTVERIAKAVQQALQSNGNTAVLDQPQINGEENPLSLRNYVGDKYDVIQLLNTQKITQADNTREVEWLPADTASKSYTLERFSRDNNASSAVYQNNGGVRTPLYWLAGDGIIMKSTTPVSLTVSGLSGLYMVGGWKGSTDILLYANGQLVNNFWNWNNRIAADAEGKITFTIRTAAGVTNPENITGESLKISQLTLQDNNGNNISVFGTQEVNAARDTGEIKWLPAVGADNCSILMGGAYSDTGRYLAGIEKDGNKETVLYTLEGDGLVLRSNKSVSQTFTGLRTDYKVNIGWKGNGAEVYVNGVLVQNGTVVSPDAAGNIKVTIQAASWVTNHATAGDTIKVANLSLNPIGDYPLGVYEESKAKYDGVAVYQISDEQQKTLYWLSENGLTLKSKTSVAKEVSGLTPGGRYTVVMLKDSDQIEVSVGGNAVDNNTFVDADENGNIKFTISTQAENIDDAFKVESISLVDENGEEIAVLGEETEENETNFEEIEWFPEEGRDDCFMSELGWTDITTCMDYAYFVTSNLFKYNASLNKQYNDYEQLVFHKVDDDGKVAYEFAADQHHENVDLIYNKANKTIRNASDTDTGLDTTTGDERKAGGSLFLCDDIEKDYPGIDTNMTADDGQQHNFHYTVSTKSKFVYKKGAGQYFYFSGDDDVYVYVNGKLLVDLGGAHQQLDGEFNLDDLAEENPELGLEDGKVVDFAFFYMERHATASNFYGKMNFKLANDELQHMFDYDTIPYGYLVDLKYSFSSMRELNTNKSITFTDNFGNVIGAKGFTLGNGVLLKDNKLTVTVKDEDGKVDSARGKEFTFVNPSSPTEQEIKAVTDYFKILALEKGETVEISGPQYDTATKPYDEYEDIAGEGVNSKQLNFTPEVEYEAWMVGATVPTKGKLKINNPVKVIVGSITVCTGGDDNEKKDLADYGEFKIIRTQDLEDVTGEISYQNKTDALLGSELTIDKLPRGYYTLILDEKVLTGYTVTINGEEVPALTIPFEPIPTYDPVNKKWDWEYPEVKFELKAVRNINPLKDLT